MLSDLTFEDRGKRGRNVLRLEYNVLAPVRAAFGGTGGIGVRKIFDQQFGARLRARYGASVEGTPLVIKVRRGTETLTLQGKLQFAGGDVVVEADPAASAKAVRIGNGILKGVVDR